MTFVEDTYLKDFSQKLNDLGVRIKEHQIDREDAAKAVLELSKLLSDWRDEQLDSDDDIPL